MRSSVLLFLLPGGCLTELLPDADELKTSWRSNQDMGPDDPHLHAAILDDVRRERVLTAHLDQGVPDCPAIKMSSATATCLNDGAAMQVLSLRSDPIDQPNRIQETAFYCPKERVYYYHFEGGPRRLGAWLGPFRIGRKLGTSD